MSLERNAAGAEVRPTVADAPQRRRYEITLDGELAGFADYVDEGAQRIFHHTELEDRFAGQGLASALLAEALADTRSQGKRIVPVCSFVVKYVSRHPEFDDITDPSTPALVEAVRATQD